MAKWPDTRILDLFGIEIPILAAPMAGPITPKLAIAVSAAGGLGSLPCALLTIDQARADIEEFRAATARPLNVNFFCHTPPKEDAGVMASWRKRLAPYYRELGLDPDAPVPASARAPFDDGFCTLVEEYRPEVVSFHFGLPEKSLFDRVKKTGAKIISSATSVSEAKWLEDHGCDAVIAMGFEAGGHQGHFLNEGVATQVGGLSLIPQIADAVTVPVIAAGGIADGRGIVAAFVLGASGVQIGTAYMFSPEAKMPKLHLEALRHAQDNTALTNLFTGRPARGILNRLMREQGPLSDTAPAFPLAGGALAPLRSAAEPKGIDSFQSLWSGQSAALAKPMPAGDFTRYLAAEALTKLDTISKP